MSLLKQKYDTDKIFLYNYDTGALSILLVLFKPWLYLSKNDIKSDYPYHVIIKGAFGIWSDV